MNKKALKIRIKEETSKLGLEKETVVKLSDMETIARKANCDLIDVMRYLRYER